MTSSAYFNTVVSQPAFRARFKAENGKTFSDIEDAAASGWGRRHLLACRVVRREPQPNVLPILSHYTPSDRKRLPDEIEAFLEGPDLGLMDQSEHSLVRNLGHPISFGSNLVSDGYLQGKPGPAYAGRFYHTGKKRNRT